jgi:hypothetical protein
VAEVTPITATQIMADQSRHRLRAALDHLLYRLKDFIEVRPMMEDDKLPEHDVVWVDYHERGPAKTILDANKAHPELWRDALPEEVVIVPRKMLAQVGLTADVIDALAGYGGQMVAAKAARHEYDLQNADRR